MNKFTFLEIKLIKEEMIFKFMKQLNLLKKLLPLQKGQPKQLNYLRKYLCKKIYDFKFYTKKMH